MIFKPKKTGINFLCDAIILPHSHRFKREFEHKYPDFKNISSKNWNLFISVYFTIAVQKSMQQMNDWEYIKLMGKTVDYFEIQYPTFRTALKSLVDCTPIEDSDETQHSIWIASNLLQKITENLTKNDIDMGDYICQSVKKLANVVDATEIMTF